MPTLYPPKNGITKFTNCRILKGDALVAEDLWVSAVTGKIVETQAAFYDDLVMPEQTIDLHGRIVSPGLIDVQLNGAFGLNFSTELAGDMAPYAQAVRDLNRRLVQTGVTSYVPTVTSQTSALYRAVLPHLAPSGARRRADDGAESLGAHCEGPFLNPGKHGIHNVDALREARSVADLEAMYGAANIDPRALGPGQALPVKMITAAPELGRMSELIPELRARGIVYSMGHSEATYEDATAAVAAGATMITHLFNAMRPLHHRNPGIFGVLGSAESLPRPYFGIISDGIHLHPNTIKIAYNAHPDGFILVTDAMHMVGLPDGRYSWTNGEGAHYIIKKGFVLTLEGTDSIAGSSITLIECANNFLKWSGTSIPNVLRAVTSTPAEMLGLKGTKGSLDAGADADLVIFTEKKDDNGAPCLVIDEVWKFGSRVHDGSEESEPPSPVCCSPSDSAVGLSSPKPSSPEPEFTIVSDDVIKEGTSTLPTDISSHATDDV